MFTIIILILTLFSSAFILVNSLKHRQKSGATSLVLFIAFVLVAALANLGLERFPQIRQSYLLALIYLGWQIAYSAILIFTIQFTHHENWLKPSNLIWLGLEPLLTQILFWTNPRNFLFSTDLYFQPAPSQTNYNLWATVDSIYSTILLLFVLVLLAQNFNSRTYSYQRQTMFIMAGIGTAILINTNISTATLIFENEIKILSLLAIGIALITGFLNAGLFEITPITREKVIQGMKDGWIVLDNNNQFVDINLAAEKIIGIPGNKLTGQSAEKIFIDWPNLMNGLKDNRDIELKGSVQIKGKWTYLDIHISPLIDINSTLFGKLIVWRDITERRLADEARQQARDEMFILLHSITSAASRAINLDDFLSESIYQIVYSSHSQSITVYILEDYDMNRQTGHLVLAAQHGVPMTTDSKMVSIPVSLEIVKTVLELGEPLLIPNMQTDDRVPLPMRNIGPNSFLLIPMITESQVLGIIALTRAGNSPYTPDEIARLTAVSDEVATFIHSNRQRQLSIALAERQKLVRDLHDSVTQKLYGLVTLAEATQAGIQAGVIDMPAKVIVRMAENARQALKEMRLFLFQMQPVDFERDGLSAAIQHRLSAVEGRADIQARLMADDDISLPVEKELGLYFIAQEALNNVIKHARASNVKVFLKNKKSNFSLEVEDDGCGFDPKTTDSGGIGLRSMRERAIQIGGRLKITSAPGIGTRISVTIKIL